MPKKGRRTSLWIPKALDEQLKQHPDVVVNRVCTLALEKACSNDDNQNASTDESAIAAELSKTEEKVRTMTKAMEGIARRAARQADMVVLTKTEYELFRDVFDTSIEHFVLTVQQKAVEDYIKAQRRAKRSSEKIEKPTVEETVPVDDEPERVFCVCGDEPDTACSHCGKPLCWLCWTGHDNDEEPAIELCPDCLSSP